MFMGLLSALMSVYHMCSGVHGGQRECHTPGTGVTDHCKYVDVESGTRILLKISHRS